jgi:hypothetical protein
MFERSPLKKLELELAKNSKKTIGIPNIVGICIRKSQD